MTKTERRRNQYAGHCSVCSADVPVGAGWLYSDTHSRRGRSIRAGTGRFPKLVKCNRCHDLGVSSKSQLPENATPKPVKLGVAAIRGGRFVPAYEKVGYWPADVVRLVLADGTSEIIAQPEARTYEPIGIGDCYGAGRLCFGGRVLTHEAAKELETLGWYAAEILETLDLRRIDE